MSDRQTPKSVIDRARACILKFRASVIGMPLPSRLLMAECDLRDLADQIQNIGIRHPEVGPGFVQQMTADQFRDHVVNSAAKGELYLWGVKVVIDDAALEIRCEGATRGVKEYRGDQHAGVDNSVQAAQGCRVAAGVSDGADLCTLGTADFTSPTVLRQLRLLALWRWPEEDIAELLGVTLGELACAAWENNEVLAALSPSSHERDAYVLQTEEKSARRAASRQDHRASTPSARIRNAVSARLWAALKGRTDGALFSRLGYSADELVSHLQAQFTPGMSWENYGRWHVDHIKPCAGYDQTDPEQFRECWALSNLQPLWAADNLRKGARAWEN
ncbi:hypothetical protein [Stenotrophomonas maltophilia]|uniref:Uncharacterized protein n=1 Tax=Stenotrophomonas maltophilia TaxID=40324 RepID=A0A4S2D3V1_STEMA|nr:hypothetical protein [Stenotrophomonas maltophilia]TGY35243.1 hypothetical protein E5352_05855 [Stenotrophomonas maltophilia]